MSEEEKPNHTIQDRVNAMSAEEKDMWLSIFFMLSACPRYTKFVNNNFKIDQVIDHENKMVDVRVQEKEPPPFEFDTVQKMKLMLLCQNYNCSKPADLCEKIANLMAGKKVGDVPPLIAKATDADVAVAAKERGSKLDV